MILTTSFVHCITINFVLYHKISFYFMYYINIKQNSNMTIFYRNNVYETNFFLSEEIDFVEGLKKRFKKKISKCMT